MKRIFVGAFLDAKHKKLYSSYCFLTLEPNSFREQLSTDAFEHEYILSRKGNNTIGNKNYTIKQIGFFRRKDRTRS